MPCATNSSLTRRQHPRAHSRAHPLHARTRRHCEMNSRCVFLSFSHRSPRCSHHPRISRHARRLSFSSSGFPPLSWPAVLSFFCFALRRLLLLSACFRVAPRATPARKQNRLSVPRSGAERRFYSRGGRHRRAAHWAVLSFLDVTHRKPTSKNRSHTREERKTRTAYAIKQKIAHVGLSAPHDGAQLKTSHPPLPLFFFIKQSQVPKAERVYLQARGAGMTTPAWCCRRR